jgi:uncharacterized protein
MRGTGISDPLSNKTISTSLENARRLAVTKQHLAGKIPRRSTTESILSVVRDCCYIQWDPIDAVAPSHIISFWSRLGNFRPTDVDKLLWSEKKLFLHWTPIASIALTEDYPIYDSMMRRYPESLSDSWGGNKRRARKFLAEHKELSKKILSELKKKGPLKLTQFQDHVRSKSPDGWTSGSDVSNMLFYLLMKGEVMVVGHAGLQNIYGLSEEFLPKWIDRKELTEEEFEREAAQRALRALGIATPREIHIYFPRGCYLNLKKTLEGLEKESKIHRVHIEGLSGRDDRYIHELDIPILESIDSDDWEPRMTLLAPFDNLLALQGRLKRLFHFEYIHENFLPQNKRKFGTFVHPILWEDQLIGRADLRMDRENEKLNVISVHAESGALGKQISSKIGEMMDEFGDFLGAKEVVYSSRVPSAWRSALH